MTAPVPAWAPAAPPAEAKVFTLRRLDVLSVAKMQALILAALGVLFALLWLLWSSLMAAAFGLAEGGILAAVGLSALVVLPLLYGALGFVTGAIAALAYNAAAKWLGGIRFTVE